MTTPQRSRRRRHLGLGAGLVCLALSGIGSQPVTADPAAPQAPLAACQGFSWQRVAGPDKSVTALGGSPTFDRVLAASQDSAGGKDFLWSGRITDLAWPAVTSPGLGGLPLTDVLVTPEMPGELARVWVSVFGDGNVFGSATGEGQTFSRKGNLTGWVMRLATSGSTVFAAASKPGAQQGIWAWAGNDWAQRNDGALINTAYFRDLKASAGGQVLWLGTDARGLWRSTDGGITWEQMGTDNAQRLATVRSLAVDPARPDRVVAGLGRPHDATAYNGTKGLRIWQGNQLERAVWADGDIDLVAAIEFSKRSASTIYAALWGHGLQVSTDGGQTWQVEAAPTEQPFELEALLTLVPPTDPGCELLFAGGHGGLWVRNVARPTFSILAPVALNDASW